MGVGKIGDGLSAVCTVAAPIFIVGDMIWGSTEDQYHKVVMAKLKEIEEGIENIRNDLKDSTNAIKLYIGDQTHKELVSHLTSVAETYGNWVKTGGSQSDAIKLADYYLDLGKDLEHLKSTIEQYFKDYQNANNGRCTELANMRTWLAATMQDALLGATVGCVRGVANAHGKTEAEILDDGDMENECLMSVERDDILAIEDKMIGVLLQCD